MPYEKRKFIHPIPITCIYQWRSVSLLLPGVRGLENVSIDIPLAVAAGTTVNMSCRYDLQSDALYTVKWYKGSEFFRYVPKEMPPIAMFGELGAKVVVSNTLMERGRVSMSKMPDRLLALFVARHISPREQVKLFPGTVRLTDGSNTFDQRNAERREIFRYSAVTLVLRW